MTTSMFTASTANGQRIVADLHFPTTPPKGLVLLLHGLFSSRHSSTNQAIMPHLEQASLISICLDFPGHGDSDGDIRDTCVTSGAQAVAVVIERVLNDSPQLSEFPLVVLGSSFGGAVAVASLPQIAPCGVVLKSPALDIPGFMRRVRGEAVMQQWEQDGILYMPEFGPDASLSYHIITDARGYDTYALAQSQNIPFAVVHGTQDETVPVEQSRKIALSLGSQCNYKEIETGDHRFSQPEDFHQAVQFCAQSCIEMIPT